MATGPLDNLYWSALALMLTAIAVFAFKYNGEFRDFRPYGLFVSGLSSVACIASLLTSTYLRGRLPIDLDGGAAAAFKLTEVLASKGGLISVLAFTEILGMSLLTRNRK